MPKITSFLVAVFLLTLAGEAFAVSVEEVPNPRVKNRWVTDMTSDIDSRAENRINERLDALHRDQGVEVAVVTVQSVDTATPKDFATELFNYWGIGKAGVDNGLLVLMVMGERRLEMETGYGMEATLPDGWLKRMQMSQMIPHFKSGDFGKGLEAGVVAVDEHIRANPDGVTADPNAVYEDYGAPDRGGNGWWWFVLGALGLGGAGGGAGWWRHKKNRTCPDCNIGMTMLPEDEDDEHLSEGEQLEEAIGSIDYQFYYCEECDFDKIIPVKAWFSGFSTCPQCHHRTLSTTTNTVRSATYSSSGLKEIISDCANCHHHSRRTRTIPRKTRSSSSSSSFGGGGSSFGGGSSGGGGAGSSW